MKKELYKVYQNKRYHETKAIMPKDKEKTKD